MSNQGLCRCRFSPNIFKRENTRCKDNFCMQYIRRLIWTNRWKILRYFQYAYFYYIVLTTVIVWMFLFYRESKWNLMQSYENKNSAKIDFHKNSTTHCFSLVSCLPSCCCLECEPFFTVGKKVVFAFSNNLLWKRLLNHCTGHFLKLKWSLSYGHNTQSIDCILYFNKNNACLVAWNILSLTACANFKLDVWSSAWRKRSFESEDTLASHQSQIILHHLSAKAVRF